MKEIFQRDKVQVRGGRRRTARLLEPIAREKKLQTNGSGFRRDIKKLLALNYSAMLYDLPRFDSSSVCLEVSSSIFTAILSIY